MKCINSSRHTPVDAMTVQIQYHSLNTYCLARVSKPRLIPPNVSQGPAIGRETSHPCDLVRPQ